MLVDMIFLKFVTLGNEFLEPTIGFVD